MATPHLKVLLNANAGSGAHDAASLRERFASAGIDAEVEAVEGHALPECVDALRAAGVRQLGVAGGDGTLRTAASGLAGSAIALVPIPCGTLNTFARRVGITDVEEAAQAVSRGGITHVPVGIVDERVFLNTATFGLYADVVRRREKYRRYLTKWPAAVVSFFMSMRRMQMLEAVLEVEGERLVRETPLIWVGLGWGSFPRVDEAEERRSSPDLEIAVLRPRSAVALIAFTARIALQVLRGEQPVRDPALEILHARHFLLRARRPVDHTLDGETFRGRAPFFVAVQDDALSVFAS